MEIEWDMVIKGRVWRFGDNVDTDQIYPGKYLPLTDEKEMANHAMEGTERGEEFIKRVRKGDIIVAGKNFGCGSSREQAVIALKGIGISLVVASSFARIFYRNAVNRGLFILESPTIEGLRDGDVLQVDLRSGEIMNITTSKRYKAKPLSGLEMDILRAGGLISYLKSETRKD